MNWIVRAPLGSSFGSVRPRRNPGRLITPYQALDLRSAANRLDGLYPITSGAVAKLVYQRTQSPFCGPMSCAFTEGTALMKTSPGRSLSLIWLASAPDPAPNPRNCAPVAELNAGPTSFSITLTSDPAYRTVTGPIPAPIAAGSSRPAVTTATTAMTSAIATPMRFTEPPPPSISDVKYQCHLT